MDFNFSRIDQTQKNLDIEDVSDSSSLLPCNFVASTTSASSYFNETSNNTKGREENVVDIQIEDNETPPFSWKKLWIYTGPGILMSIAFLDPGNIEGDLQAGAIAGYSLIWLLLWATIMGLFIQLLSARVGVATGRHLAELCREEYPPWARIILWVMAEVAVIAADIQEVVGTAIAIQILSHGLFPLWLSVVITAADCFVFLFLERYGVRKMEGALTVMVATMAISFAYMFIDAEPNTRELLIGTTVPKLSSKTIQQAVGIFGCVITPHNVYLHSALVQSRKIDKNKMGQVEEAIKYYSIESSVALIVSFFINLFVTTVFAKGFYGTEKAASVGLANAGQYLEDKYGGGGFPILYMWGIGLLAAGQSSTITGTYAGQFIMGGFLNLRLKEWIRAIITRSFAIIPTMILVIIFDRSDGAMDALNEWLNVLQSMQIPFSLIPLFTLVSKQQIMGVFRLGTNLQMLSWIIVALVMVINSYVLFDFFDNVVHGVVSTILFCFLSVGYVTFNIYLIFRDGTLPAAWVSKRLSERFSYNSSTESLSISDVEGRIGRESD